MPTSPTLRDLKGRTIVDVEFTKADDGTVGVKAIVLGNGRRVWWAAIEHSEGADPFLSTGTSVPAVPPRRKRMTREVLIGWLQAMRDGEQTEMYRKALEEAIRAFGGTWPPRRKRIPGWRLDPRRPR